MVVHAVAAVLSAEEHAINPSLQPRQRQMRPGKTFENIFSCQNMLALSQKAFEFLFQYKFKNCRRGGEL